MRGEQKNSLEEVEVVDCTRTPEKVEAFILTVETEELLADVPEMGVFSFFPKVLVSRCQDGRGVPPVFTGYSLLGPSGHCTG